MTLEFAVKQLLVAAQDLDKRLDAMQMQINHNGAELQRLKNTLPSKPGYGTFTLTDDGFKMKGGPDSTP